MRARRKTDGKSADPQTSHVPENIRHGSFHNYYGMRKDIRRAHHDCDPRVHEILKFLASERKRGNVKVGKQERLLDIGCNDGSVIFQMDKNLPGQPLHFVGVDIDKDLISHAKQKVNSSCSPDPNVSEGESQPQVLGIGCRSKVIRTEPRKRLRLDLPQDRHGSTEFFCADWTYNDGLSDEQSWSLERLFREDMQGYDYILALSVAKWIHIDHYDDGLRHFFARIASCLRVNGILVLETQPYRSYKQTMKVTQPGSQSRRNFYALRVLPDDFPWILCEELGLDGPYEIVQAGVRGLSRSIHVYFQPAGISEACQKRREFLSKLTRPTDPLYPIRDTIPWVPRYRQGFVY